MVGRVGSEYKRTKNMELKDLLTKKQELNETKQEVKAPVENVTIQQEQPKKVTPYRLFWDLLNENKSENITQAQKILNAMQMQELVTLIPSELLDGKYTFLYASYLFGDIKKSNWGKVLFFKNATNEEIQNILGETKLSDVIKELNESNQE